MQDGIIKGTGNSRLLKSAITEATTWEEFRAALIAGTLPIDLAGINAAGWQQIGMALSKANLLSDTTASKYFASLVGTETVDQVLAKLGAAALIDGTALTDMFGNAVGVQVATGSYTGTGTYGMDNPNNLTFPGTPVLLIVGIPSTGLKPYNNYWVRSFIWIEGQTMFGAEGSTSGYSNISRNGNELDWYSANNAGAQCNETQEYRYLALCIGG